MVGVQPGSLGPVNPSWLARLSAHLGINPVKTLSSLLMSIWPGKEFPSICCREICALLMLAESYNVPLAMVDAHLQQALRKRGIPWPPTFSLQRIIEHDAHFLLESADNGDLQVRLALESIPAPAVAQLYLPPGASTLGTNMLTPEKALLHAALHLTWPRALHDDDEYLAAQIGLLLIDEAEAFPGANRGLARYSMHLTEVGGCLRTQSNSDMRLAQIFPKGQYMKAKRPRLSEFLMKDNLLEFFRVQESTLRQSEKVVTLRTEVMLRSLGPLVGLLESALTRPRVVSYGPGPSHANSFTVAENGPSSSAAQGTASTFDGAILGSDLAPSALTLAWKTHEYPSMSLPLRNSQAEATTNLPENLCINDMPRHLNDDLKQLVGHGPSDRLESTPHSSFAAFSPSNVFTSRDHNGSHSLFTPGLHILPSDVPAEIRNFWSDAPACTSTQLPMSPHGKASTAAMTMPTPTKIEPSLVGRLGVIGAPHNNVSNPQAVDVTNSDWNRSSSGHVAETTPRSLGFVGASPTHAAASLHSGWAQASSPVRAVVPTIGWNGAGADSNQGTPPRSDWDRNTQMATQFARPVTALSPGSSVSDISSHTALAHMQNHARGRPQRGPLFLTGMASMDNGNSPHASAHSTSSPCVDHTGMRNGISQLSSSLSGCWTGNAKSSALSAPSGEANGFLGSSPLAYNAIDSNLVPASGDSTRYDDDGAKGQDSATGSIWPCISGGGIDSHTAPDSAGAVSVCASTGEHTPGSSAQSGGVRPMNYATALRAPGQQPPVSASLARSVPRGSEDLGPSATVDHARVVQLLDDRGTELMELLGEPWGGCVVSDVVSWRQGFVKDGRINRDELNRLFMVSAKRYLTGEESLVGRIDKASAGTLKMLLLTDDHPRAGQPSSGPPTVMTGNPLTLLRPQVRNEVLSLIEQHPGVLREEHFDTGVVFHLQRKTEASSIAALRAIAQRSDFLTANNMPAYLTHWLMKVSGKIDPAPPPPASTALAKVAQRSAKPDMRKLPRGIAKAVEDLVESSQWLDWRHFDAGVMKVLQQLALANEEEAKVELQQVEDSELSSVKNMPAYLNKCFNNRLWKVRP